MYVNGKIIPVETIPAMEGEGRIKENGGMVERVNSSMIYLIYIKNFCKCHNIPPPNTTIKNKQKRRHLLMNTQCIPKPPNLGKAKTNKYIHTKVSK
jgi:translation initiation factor 2 beta subunit (eIF-2beta)/eIF-5